MIFNFIIFLGAFTLFFILYWFALNRNLRLQNAFILAGSYIFYTWIDYRFLSLLIGNSLLNYFLGIHIQRASNETRKRYLLYLGLAVGLLTLFYFKYSNFFISSIVSCFSILHINFNIYTTQILLPLGISFYTFRSLSYIIDIYRGKIKPTTDWVVFFSFVAFFPCLISGPIDRANLLIPQLERNRHFTYENGADGMRQILWGLFKKMVIADNCSIITKQIFDNYNTLPGSTLLLGAFFFTIGLYADFSGYSDMAIGFARLLGFNITKNFNYPFFAQNIPDYWRRWHISLTSWVTDYVFTPLSIGLRDFGEYGIILAVILNMVVVGIWHGANWTFIVYGFISGLYFIPIILKQGVKKKKTSQKKTFSLINLRNILGTFCLVMLTNIIFRAENITMAFAYYRHFFSSSLFHLPVLQGKQDALAVMFFIGCMFLLEWIHREKEHGLQIEYIKSSFLKISIYFSIFYTIFIFGFTEFHKFIYFSF